MGSYRLTASGAVGDCAFPDGSVSLAPFTFTFALSTGSPDASDVTLTLDGCESRASDCPRAATWDGQLLASTASAPRTIVGCACAFTVTETIDLALLSRSQSAAVGGVCPAAALDGGVPAPNDAGILAPSLGDGGFDSILACGTLAVGYAPSSDGGAASDGGLPCGGCAACTERFALIGARR
jgi:hypothetical protein